MKRVLFIAYITWCIAFSAIHWLGPQQANAQVGQSPRYIQPVVGGAAYAGPGDVKTGWNIWYGTRAFSSATRGNALVNICNSTGGTDVLCADASSNATTGVLVIPGSLSTFCPGANCTIKIFYDQVGTNCSGSCDVSNTTVANRAILTANALGASTGTCGVFTKASSQQYTKGSYAGLAQPLTVSAVVQLASASATSYYFGAQGGFGAQGSTYLFFANANVSGPATSTSPVALQNIAGGAGTTSFIVANTTVGSSQSSANQPLASPIFFGDDPFGDFFGGTICEVGVYPAAFNTTDASNMYANQHTFWGF